MKLTPFVSFFVIPLGVASNANANLVDLSGEAFVLDLRYKTEKNFLKTNVYARFGLSRCLVHEDMAVALRRLELKLMEKKLKLVFYDCFRPVDVQREMWSIVSDPKFVANPKNGSNHNRGVAVDAGLVTSNGKPLIFPTEFDDFSPKARHTFTCPPEAKAACINRNLLKELMVSAGLKPIASEWWHYELPEAKKYPLIESNYVEP